MTRTDFFALSDERLRTQINLAYSYLEVMELCLSDHSPLAQAVVSMLIDSIVILVEEMQENVDKRGYIVTKAPAE